MAFFYLLRNKLVLRALGDSKRPRYFLIVCCVINIVLDVALVIFFNLGVKGVAIVPMIINILGLYGIIFSCPVSWIFTAVLTVIYYFITTKKFSVKKNKIKVYICP